jgi:quercetin dioxygenase-like cupin family protein
MLELPPDSVWEHVPGLKEMMYHSTASLDYGIVLAGEVWAVLDADERLMKAGDVLIQRGTAHSWSNRSGESALMAFVLVGGNVGPEQQ